MKKEIGFKPIFIVLGISMIIALFWDSLAFISVPIHSILDPSAGALLNWNLTFGLLIIVSIITIIITLVQKYTTDQETIKELKEKQKEINERAKAHRHDPEKMMEINREGLPIMSQMMKLNMRSMVFTGVPLILLFRWFMDVFGALGECGFFCNTYVIFYGWVWFYILISIVFGGLLRKALKIV